MLRFFAESPFEEWDFILKLHNFYLQKFYEHSSGYGQLEQLKTASPKKPHKDQTQNWKLSFDLQEELKREMVRVKYHIFFVDTLWFEVQRQPTSAHCTEGLWPVASDLTL